MAWGWLLGLKMKVEGLWARAPLSPVPYNPFRGPIYLATKKAGFPVPFGYSIYLTPEVISPAINLPTAASYEAATTTASGEKQSKWYTNRCTWLGYGKEKAPHHPLP